MTVISKFFYLLLSTRKMLAHLYHLCFFASTMISLRLSSVYNNNIIIVVVIFVDNYGSLKSDSTDGSGEADRIIIINKPQTQQFCNNKIR